jgi:hypothetical protein
LWTDFSRKKELESTGNSVASFNYTFFGLGKRYSCIAFAVLTKANAWRHCYANIKQFGSELH